MYPLYKYKPLNCNFVVMCLDNDVSKVRPTYSSIRGNYQAPCTCVVSDDLPESEFGPLAKTLPTIRGGKSVTSLINNGVRSGGPEWNFVVIAGTWVRPNLLKKYSYFVECEKDILFPIVDRKITFWDGSINGILVHRKTFEEVGDLPEDDSIETCKLFWEAAAVEKGCRFKAVIGARMC